MADRYRVFKRRPWKRNSAWPRGWEPNGRAHKTVVNTDVSLEAAQFICSEGNKNVRRDVPGQMYYEFERIE